jgi:thiamine-phosphate pyrophosphorylase
MRAKISARFRAAGTSVDPGFEDMADELARLQLARAASRLKHDSGWSLPPLALLTDDARLKDPLGAIAAMPPGTLVVLRTLDDARRVALAESLAGLARSHRLTWIVADDAALAAKFGADGAHFPESRLAFAARWRIRRPDWLVTCSAHSLSACARASRIGADAIFLAPVYSTLSHPVRAGLGPLRLRLIARLLNAPIYALGGIDARTARRLAGARVVGLAAIGGLSPSFTSRKLP